MKKFTYIFTALAFVSILLFGCSNGDDTSSKETTTDEVTEENESTEVQEENTPDTNEEEVEVKAEVEAPESVGNLITKEFEGITFEYPNTFAELVVENQVVPTIGFATIDNAARIAVAVEILEETMTAKEYTDVVYSNSGITPISVKEYTENELDWVEVVTNQNGTHLNQKIFVDGNKVYAFSFGSSIAYDEFIQDYENLIKSVEILD